MFISYLYPFLRKKETPKKLLFLRKKEIRKRLKIYMSELQSITSKMLKGGRSILGEKLRL